MAIRFPCKVRIFVTIRQQTRKRAVNTAANPPGTRANGCGVYRPRRLQGLAGLSAVRGGAAVCLTP
jgi:hypothetical protein